MWKISSGHLHFCTYKSSKNQPPLPLKKQMVKLSQVQKCKSLLVYFITWSQPQTMDAKWSIEIQNFWAWADKIEQINSWAFGVFSAEPSTPILVQWVPCPCFTLFNHYFYKKLSFYIHIPSIYLGYGYEYGLIRIRDLAIMRP